MKNLIRRLKDLLKPKSSKFRAPLTDELFIEKERRRGSVG